MRITLLWIWLGLLLGGCVPKGKYDLALADNAELTKKNQDQQATIEDLELEIKHLQREIDETRKVLAKTEADLDAANNQLVRLAQEQGQLKEDIDEMTLALRELEARRAETERSLQEFRDLVMRFQKLIDAGTLRVRIVDGRMVVELATDILFPPGGASLSREGKGAIKDVAEVLASIPERDFQVAGHTDDRPISTAAFPSNWHLGASRAISVAQLLIEGGLSGERVSAASYAEWVPVDTNNTKEGRANNRRIEIVVVPDLSKLPGYEELEQVGAHPGNAEVGRPKDRKK